MPDQDSPPNRKPLWTVIYWPDEKMRRLGYGPIFDFDWASRKPDEPDWEQDRYTPLAVIQCSAALHAFGMPNTDEEGMLHVPHPNGSYGEGSMFFTAQEVMSGDARHYAQIVWVRYDIMEREWEHA